MNAKKYEDILRKVYKCGNGGRDGADAKHYEKLEEIYSTLKVNREMVGVVPGVSLNKLQKEYDTQCKVVWRFVCKCIKHAITEYSRILNDEDIVRLETIASVKYHTKEGIDESILESERIFVQNKLYPI